MKKKFIILCIIIIYSLSVSADNLSQSYLWLRDKTTSDVFDNALSALAFHGKDQSGFDSRIDQLNKLKSKTQSCWPATQCTTQDTALAIMALNRAGLDITGSIKWLSSQQQSNLNGEWLLEIVTQGNSKCKIQYKKLNDVQPKEFTIQVDQGYITSARCKTPTTEFNIGECLEPNLLKSNPVLEITVNCQNLGSAGIVVNYKEQNTYYLTDEITQEASKTFTINNGNYGDYISTLLTNLALSDSNRNDLRTLVWLKKNYNSQDILQNALLFLTTKDKNYADQLVKLQDTQSGSFGNNIEKTSWAIKALKDTQQNDQAVELARTWIESKKSTDGSWNANIRNTALVLYGLYSDAAVNDLGSFSASKECIEYKDCESWSICRSGLQSRICENVTKCDYKQTQSCVEEDEEETTISNCVVNDICEEDKGEDSYNCPADCETEEPKEEISDEPVEDEEGSSLFFWVFIILIIGLIGFTAYYFYNKSKGTPKSSKKNESYSLFGMPERPPLKQPQSSSNIRPVSSSPSTSKSQLDKQLERSLNEAKKLLGK